MTSAIHRRGAETRADRFELIERVSIQEEWDVLLAQGRVRTVALEVGLAAVEAEALVTASAEIARNALWYAGAGELSVGRRHAPQGVAVYVEARDRGPGIADPVAALRDGFTTGPGLGLGLPSAKRLTDELRIDRAQAGGAVVILTKWLR